MVSEQLQFQPNFYYVWTAPYVVKASVKRVKAVFSLYCWTKQQKWRAQLIRRANYDPKSSSNKKTFALTLRKWIFAQKVAKKKDESFFFVFTLLLLAVFCVILKIILFAGTKKLYKHTHMVCKMRKVTTK